VVRWLSAGPRGRDFGETIALDICSGRALDHESDFLDLSYKQVSLRLAKLHHTKYITYILLNISQS
jgi:hypothetical protein